MKIMINDLGNIEIKTKKAIIHHSEIYFTNIDEAFYHIESEVLKTASKMIVVLRAKENFKVVSDYFDNNFSDLNPDFHFLLSDDLQIIDVFLY